MIIVCLDFDGVLTSDEVAGREFILECLGSGYKVVINSWRCENSHGVAIIEKWLMKNLDLDDADRVSVSVTTPQADIYIDDRGFRFTGTYPTMEDIYEMCSNNKLASGASL